MPKLFFAFLYAPCPMRSMLYALCPMRSMRPMPYALCSLLFHPQINHPHHTRNNQQPGHILRLRGFHPEDIDIRIGADLFNKKALDAIEEDI